MLAKNFGVLEAAFANIPTDYEHDRYIFAGQVPGPKSGDIVHSAAGLVPQTFSHRLMAQDPIIAEGGWVRIADSNNFPAASTGREAPFLPVRAPVDQFQRSTLDIAIGLAALPREA